MTDKEKLLKLRKLADAMYYAAQHLTTDASRLHKAMDEYHKFIIHECKEEPVSEELEKELSRLLKDCEIDSEYIHQDFLHIVANHFANWQKQQFEKNRLKHCNSITNEQAELESDFIDQHLDKYNRMPTFLDAIEYGMNLQKEQMMKKAVSGHVGQTINGMLRVLSDETFGDMGFTAGDKVKLIIIKED